MIRKTLLVALATLAISPLSHAGEGEFAMPASPAQTTVTSDVVYVYSIYYFNKRGGPTHYYSSVRSIDQAQRIVNAIEAASNYKYSAYWEVHAFRR